MQSKVDYYDNCMNNEVLMTSSQIAKDFGLTANELNTILDESHILYRRHGDWIVYNKYVEEGLTRTQLKDGKYIKTLWTEKGREFIYDLLIRRGFKPHAIINDD